MVEPRSHLGEGQEVEEYPESPYVHGKVVSPFEGHLGGEIFLCAAEGGVYPPRRPGLDELCATKVGNDEMTGDIDKDVLRFQISVDDPCLVEGVDRKDQLTGIKPGCVRVQCAISQMGEKVPPGAEVLCPFVSLWLPETVWDLR